VVMSYASLVMTKMVLALIGGLLALIATVMFAVQIDDSEKYGFRVSRGISFYLQYSIVCFGYLRFILYSKKTAMTTMRVDAASPSSATTINNPGFKEPRTKNGISVTDARKTYAGIRNGSGSVASMGTMVTSVSMAPPLSCHKISLRSS
ncbi:hypothetical protein DOY81_014349, partial [Sarcophaga bullata]